MSSNKMVAQNIEIMYSAHGVGECIDVLGQFLGRMTHGVRWVVEEVGNH